jgi:hypothetical protein
MVVRPTGFTRTNSRVHATVARPGDGGVGRRTLKAELNTMHRTKRGVRRITALLVGCGAAGLAIGWRYAERQSTADGYSRTLSG